MLDLSESRAQIDVIDKEITRLFQKRIDVCRDVALSLIHIYSDGGRRTN